ncbi:MULTISPECIES: arsinothricin resistance N-acetyltransferase ArsN1 family B [unclassified Bradyrhizobium]|uniref:arsinothricin resistance N-acetyltransferase ArsN1 family B n=1 Tax=unclassified Bradyrhizobium TaxID=2631580 RepID=UPI0028E7FC46|nr:MULTISPECIES: arsinothricin resistance N-acetyltransferase ArsN1 family B [unclassified Bradyrhizobium]
MHTLGKVIRTAHIGDARDIHAIYAPIVIGTAISFEIEPPSVAQIEDRIKNTLLRFPYLVCVADEKVIGYAYAGAHRERAAYRWSVDVTIYVNEEARGSGVGRSLYSALITILQRQHFHAAFAGITLPNEPSVALHKSLGFQFLGTYEEVGFKFGRWHSVSWWRRGLGNGHPVREPVAFEALRDELPALLCGDQIGAS